MNYIIYDLEFNQKNNMSIEVNSSNVDINTVTTENEIIKISIYLLKSFKLEH